MENWTKEEVFKATAEREHELAVLRARKKFYEEEDDQFILIGQMIITKENAIQGLRNILRDLVLEEIISKNLRKIFTMEQLKKYDSGIVDYIKRDMGDDASEQDVLDLFDKTYQGCFDSLADWAECHLRETGALEDLPLHLGDYVNNWGDFNFEKYASDEEENERIYSVELGLNNVHVFRNRN
jgi:hypothetical protein